MCLAAVFDIAVVFDVVAAEYVWLSVVFNVREAVAILLSCLVFLYSRRGSGVYIAVVFDILYSRHDSHVHSAATAGV